MLKKDISESDLAQLKHTLVELGCEYRQYGETEPILRVMSRLHLIDKDFFLSQPGVESVAVTGSSYLLAARKSPDDRTAIQVGDIRLAGDSFTLIAGPCAVESEDQMLQIAEKLAQLGIRFLRGGAFKPRTSPYTFQGLGAAGLAMLRKAADRFGLKVVTEAISSSDVEVVSEYADVIQLGSRNMQNFRLLKTVGRQKKPVLLKRGMSATVEEFLLAAEYVLQEGNAQVILCERGIRTFETATRNTLDISVVPLVRQLSHLPIFVDPSHASGKRALIAPLSRAALAAGADGLLIEVHPQPDFAVSDGPQTIDFVMFEELLASLKLLAPVMSKQLS